MKRKLAGTLFLAMLLFFPAPAGAAMVGTFTGVQGSVDLLSPGKEAVTVTPGDRLQADDIIRTKSGAKCEVALPDGSVIRVAPNSRLRVVVQDRGRRPVKFELLSGKIETIVKNTTAAALSGGLYSRYGAELRNIVKTALAVTGKANYEVHTPTAVYSMRGTQSFVYYLGGVSSAIVTEGTVKGYGANKPFATRTIGAGQVMVLSDSNGPPIVRPASTMEVELHSRETALSGKPGEGGKGEIFAVQTARESREEAWGGGARLPVETAGYGLPQFPAAAPVHLADVELNNAVESSLFATAAPSPPQPPFVPLILTDKRPPEITFSGMPANDISGSSTLNIGVSANEQADFTYTLNGVTVASANLAGLPEGSNIFTVTAIDQAGNAAVKAYSWTTDYTPPVVALTDLPSAPHPGKVTGETAADFGLSAADPHLGDSYYRLNGGSWQTLADTVLSLSGLAEGQQRIEFKAADLAGNESPIASYEWYIGGKQYTLSGGVSGTSAGSIQSSSEGLRAASDQLSGAWLLDYSGVNDQGAMPSALDLAAGGIVTGPEGTDEGYWLSKTDQAAVSGNNIAGSSTFTHLSSTKMGGGAGSVTGTYGSGAWQVQDLGLGTYREQPLALGARLDASYHYYDNATEAVELGNGSLTGLLGITASPFVGAADLNVAGKPLDLLLMGQSVPAGDSTWWGELTEPYLPDGGTIPLGLTGGRTASRNDLALSSAAGFREGLEGLLVGLYVDKDGNGGLLEGSFDGDFYPQNDGLFAATGTLQATRKSDGFGPADGYNKGFIDGNYYGRLADGAGNDAGSVTTSSSWGIAATSWGYLGSYSYWLEKSGVPEPWGIFNIELGGNYQQTGGAGTVRNWKLHLGGALLRGLEPSEYWFAETANGTWAEMAGDKRITADLTGRYLTPTTLGTLSGRVIGSYDTGSAAGSWEAIALGTFVDTEPLSFVSDLWTGDGVLSALVGGSADLWRSTNTPVTMMGVWDGSAGIWSAPFFSENFNAGTATTYDNGAYSGFSSLIMDGGHGVDGGLIALYVDPEGQAGYLQGTLAGASYPELQLFTAGGSLTRLAMAPAPAGVDAAGLIGNIAESGQMPLSVPAASAAAGFLSEMRNEAWIAGVTSWGIWQSLLEGTGADTAPASWSWQTMAGAEATYWTNYSDMTWTSATSKMSGLAAGAKADWINASTYVFGGEIKGLFDPSTAGWNAASQGVSIETARFLDMAAVNPAALQAMNIPAVHVGSVTLSQGAGAVNNLANVTMDNVRFFATSTGSVPRIWATNDVGGNYVNAGPIPGGAVVPLAGGGLNANFEVRNWNAAAGVWGANITGGTGNLSGGSYIGPVNFSGGAAGRIGAGTFTGSGAGIVK